MHRPDREHDRPQRPVRHSLGAHADVARDAPRSADTCDCGAPTGEARRAGVRVAFDRRHKLGFHGASVTTHAGLLAFRELDEALGLTTTAGGHLLDIRTGMNGGHSSVRDDQSEEGDVERSRWRQPSWTPTGELLPICRSTSERPRTGTYARKKAPARSRRSTPPVCSTPWCSLILGGPAPEERPPPRSRDREGVGRSVATEGEPDA